MPLTQVQGGMILPSTTLTTPIVATTMGVGGATPASSGSGITFPATQSASTDANTLDDYEEGTFTPTIAGSTTAGTTTYLNQNGWYTKIGNQVTVNIFVNVSAVTGTGSLRIGGLPFTTRADANYQGSFPLLVGGLNWTGAGTNITGYYGPSYNYFLLYTMSDDAGYSNQQCVNEAFDMYITATYLV